MSRPLGLSAGAGVDPGHAARPARDFFRHARHRGGRGRAARDRNPASAADRGARGRRAFRDGPEGLVRDAAQAQPRAVREPAGLARLVRGYALAALEDVALWHERDISHSSVERMIGPTPPRARFRARAACRRRRPARRLSGAHAENLDRLGGLIHSQRVLLALIEAGCRARTPTRWCSGMRWRPGRRTPIS